MTCVSPDATLILALDELFMTRHQKGQRFE